MNKWIIKKFDSNKAADLSRNTGITMLCAEILSARGLDSPEKAAQFLNVSQLESPFAMKDMQNAVDIINSAVDNFEKICVYGDYDCDGITSTVMLYSFLECIGADVSYYIPERAEGYGLNSDAVKKLAEDDVKLIITVDNGISALDESRLAKELGMKLVITDHHQVGDTLPFADAIINPHQNDCESSFKNLCGAGVVLKLIAAMDGGEYDMAFEQFGDLAAIATVADIVPLIGENRFIVLQGLQLLDNTEKLGLLALINASGLADKNMDSLSLGFVIAPRINAAGRFGSPKDAARLLLSDNPDEADSLARKLCNLNVKRKDTEMRIINEIQNCIDQNPNIINDRVLVFSGLDWHHGVVGIVAARVMEKLGKPCIVISIEGEFSRGSVRSFGGFSVFEALNYCSDLLIKFGSHECAGGFSLKSDLIQEFTNRINQYAKANFDDMPDYTIYLDVLMKPQYLNPEIIQSLDLLEPCGESNKTPLFLLHNAEILDVIPVSKGAHTKLKLKYGSAIVFAMMFKSKTNELIIKNGEIWDFAATVHINQFAGNINIILHVKDYRKSGVKQSQYFAGMKIYEKYLRNEDIPHSYYHAMCPDRNEIAQVYKLIPKSGINIGMLYSLLQDTSINYCKMMASIDTLKELSLVYYDAFNSIVSLKPVTHKVKLDDSPFLRRLKSNL